MKQPSLEGSLSAALPGLVPSTIKGVSPTLLGAHESCVCPAPARHAFRPQFLSFGTLLPSGLSLERFSTQKQLWSPCKLPWPAELRPSMVRGMCTAIAWLWSPLLLGRDLLKDKGHFFMLQSFPNLLPPTRIPFMADLHYHLGNK